MKTISLFKIIFFYLAVGIIILLIFSGFCDFALLEERYHFKINFNFFKDLAFLASAAFIIYFSIRFYQKNNENIQLNYQTLFNGCPLAMYVMDQESLKILVVNEAMTRLYGYSEQEFLQMTTFDIRPAEEHDRIRNFLKACEGTITESGVWLHQKKNGEVFYVDINFHMLPLGNKYTYLVMVTDIDKSINDEKKIKDLIHLYEVVNKATHDVIWDYEIATDRMNWMQGYQEVYGYTAESSSTKFWVMEKIHFDDRMKVLMSFEEIIREKKKEWTLEYRYICADGYVKYVRNKGYMIFDQQGEPVRMIGALQDIDKQKRYEQQLLSQNAQLKEIAWLNSHRVRRPLSNILGLISLIKASCDNKEEVLQFIDLLAVSSKELDDAVILINKQTMEGKGDAVHKEMT